MASEGIHDTDVTADSILMVDVSTRGRLLATTRPAHGAQVPVVAKKSSSVRLSSATAAKAPLPWATPPIST